MRRAVAGSTTVLVGCLCALTAVILAQVLCSALDINPIIRFEVRLPLIGKALTLNSLLDLQWHLLVIIGLIPAGMVWLRNGHVRVDFFYETLPPKRRLWVDLLGNLVFAMPFFALMLPASWDFMMRAWRSGEGSRNGGMDDLWLIKAVLPLGLGLLALAVVIETIRLFRAAR